MGLREMIATARGQTPADLVLKNASLVNVFSEEVYRTDIAIQAHTIVGLGEYEGKETIDLQGRFAMPGFIDGHVHVESTMLPIPEYARAVVPQGTTTIIIDPHEIANVMGIDGVKLMLASSKSTPLGVFAVLPSCVPASPFETPGATLEAYDLNGLLEKRRVVGMGEIMNYPGVLMGDSTVLDKMKLVENQRLVVDGHAPGLSGKDLNAYVAAGVHSDHESITVHEAEERLRLGMWLMVRQGSTEKNLVALLPAIKALNPHRCMFVTDDRHPGDLLREGDMNSLVRLAVAEGLNPIKAIQMATINPAEYFHFRDIGAVAPGFLADIIITNDLVEFNVDTVIKRGKVVAQHGRPLFEAQKVDFSSAMHTVNIKPLTADSFRIPGRAGTVRIIGLVPHQVTTELLVEDAPLTGGEITADVGRDILKLAVVERHHATGNIGLGLVKGFGLSAGAFASSVAHDAHNIVVVGTNDADMKAAVEKVVAMQGGLAVAKDGAILEALPLTIAGLMSPLPIQRVDEKLSRLERTIAGLGGKAEHPFMSLAFLALSVIPALKLTDKGLVDVTQFCFVPLQD
ncbi:MAG: adenine deaminase [Chloroflexota bacterium]|nr:adenine deaminase [Chloroflexota bacterium]